jgi:hypothetical protein
MPFALSNENATPPQGDASRHPFDRFRRLGTPATRRAEPPGSNRFGPTGRASRDQFFFMKSAMLAGVTSWNGT